MYRRHPVLRTNAKESMNKKLKTQVTLRLLRGQGKSNCPSRGIHAWKLMEHEHGFLVFKISALLESWSNKIFFQIIVENLVVSKIL